MRVDSQAEGRPALLGGRPLSATPLPIVRPRFPSLSTIAVDFDAALAAGQVTNHGPHVQSFEQALSAFLRVPEVCATNCGQSAVMLLLRAAGITSGEVIVPAFTFSATPHAVAWCGATPIFADVDRDTFGLDPASAATRITPRTTAILAVDPYGIPCDRSALVALGRRHSLPVLFDAAPAFGARIADHPIGTEGDGSAFSFHATKPFSTMEGGCISSTNAALIARAAALRNFGQAGGPDCDAPGINAKMPEVSALLGLAQLDALPGHIDHRNTIAKRYRAGLSLPGLRDATPHPDSTPSWLYYPLVLDPPTFGLDRDTLITALAAENIHARTYYSPACHHLTCYSDLRPPHLPIAEALAANVIALPVYNDMTPTECDTIIAAIQRIQAHASTIRRHVEQPGPKPR